MMGINFIWKANHAAAIIVVSPEVAGRVRAVRKERSPWTPEISETGGTV